MSDDEETLWRTYPWERWTAWARAHPGEHIPAADRFAALQSLLLALAFAGEIKNPATRQAFIENTINVLTLAAVGDLRH